MLGTKGRNLIEGSKFTRTWLIFFLIRILCIKNIKDVLPDPPAPKKGLIYR